MSAQFENSPQSLISRERTSKLELLLHLLANLGQPLVVCGPDGIGKTTLLNIVQYYKVESWQYCYIKGHPNLSFESILKRLGHSLYPDRPELSPSQLIGAYTQFQKHNKKIVLLIDDAGSLVPGLITTLMQYAEAHSVIRLVFALTHDDMFVISRSDRAIENSHFIELPPLSHAQCGDFLQYLASKPKAQVPLTDITDELIAHLYRETRGIPGKIIDELPELAKPKPRNPSQWVLTLVLAICLLALAVQWLRSEKRDINHQFLAIKSSSRKTDAEPSAEVPPAAANPAEAVAAVPATESAGNAEPVPPEPATSEVPADTAAPVAPELSAQNPEAAPASAEVSSEPAPESVVAETASEPEPMLGEEPPPEAAVTDPDAPQNEWLQAQPENNISLQLMVLTKPEPILALRQRYPDLTPELRYVKRVKKGKERLMVLYGSFDSMEAAISQRNALPKEFKQAIPRKISAIVKDLQ